MDLDEIIGGNKDKLRDSQGWCSPAETVDAGWIITRAVGEQGDTWRREKSWVVMGPEPDSLQSG